MRESISNNGITALAVAGTYVVMIGWTVASELETDLLGFAIRRTDKTENETYWLRGMKTFKSSAPANGLGATFSSLEQPIQSFQWADYSAKPDHDYEYKVVAMTGQPGSLKQGASVVISIRTESEAAAVDGAPPVHSVYFNRGAIASQEYARRFQDKAPSAVGQAAYDWLSRGLFEAILAFIGEAKDASYALRVAIYEFQYPGVLNALKNAVDRGVDVSIVYDAIENAKEDPVHKNDEAIDAAGLRAVCHGFTNGRIMHNKFIVLLKDGAANAVLTGSTNDTENGIFGHLNCAHVVRDEVIANTYLKYWSQLLENPTLATMREWDDTNTPAPAAAYSVGNVPVFSPQKGASTLTRYSEIAGTADRALFMTFAFGMNAAFQPLYEKTDDVLRFALMDKEAVGKDAAAGKEKIQALRNIPGTVIAVGQNIVTNAFDRWVAERDGLAPGENVRWVHTKFMLVDPLSDAPVVLTGSANFSTASVETNHENMLVIRGDTRVADIYLTEFMRQFSSYAFRDAVVAAGKGDAPKSFAPNYLCEDSSWIERYSTPGSAGALRRAYFAGVAVAQPATVAE